MTRRKRPLSRRERRLRWTVAALTTLGLIALGYLLVPMLFSRLDVHGTGGEIPGITRKLVNKLGWQTTDVDIWEVNEAFAVVAMAFIRELELDPEHVNIHGGACALGHPIGAAGARILVSLLNALDQTGGTKGIAAICLGGGEGIAVAVEMS